MSAMRARSSGKGVKSADRIQAAARRLLEAHERRERFRPLPKELAPRTEEEAYAIQDSFVALRAKKLGGIAGYKIALEIAEDLPVADAPFFRSRVAQAVGSVMPAIELADDRGAVYAELAKHPLDLIADNGWNEGAVLGYPVQEWQNVDLAGVRGVATINGKAVGEGKGAQAMGHPFDAVAWVADHLARHGRGLLRGDVVITGSLVTSKEAKAGELVKFALEGLGEAELRVD